MRHNQRNNTNGTIVKNPNCTKAIQFDIYVIYKYSREVKSGTTRDKFNHGQSESPDLKASTVTTGRHCLPKLWAALCSCMPGLHTFGLHNNARSSASTLSSTYCSDKRLKLWTINSYANVTVILQNFLFVGVHFPSLFRSLVSVFHKFQNGRVQYKCKILPNLSSGSFRL